MGKKLEASLPRAGREETKRAGATAISALVQSV